MHGIVSNIIHSNCFVFYFVGILHHSFAVLLVGSGGKKIKGIIWYFGDPSQLLIIKSWYFLPLMTHWGWVTQICVSKLTIIGSDNGLSPGRRQAIIWTNDIILLIRTFRTHISEIVNEIHTFSFKKMHFKMSSGKWRPSCLGLNVLNVNKKEYKAWTSSGLMVYNYKNMIITWELLENCKTNKLIIAIDYLYSGPGLSIEHKQACWKWDVQCSILYHVGS